MLGRNSGRKREAVIFGYGNLPVEVRIRNITHTVYWDLASPEEQLQGLAGQNLVLCCTVKNQNPS